MEWVSFSQIVQALKKVGMRQGDIVNIHSRLYSIGLVKEANADEIPAVYLRAIREVIGESGTIVVPTFTTTFARYGKPFILEESPSEMGVLSEHVRRFPGAIRTLHPVFSMAALGGQTEHLTADHPPWSVGYDTTWDRMFRLGAKVLTMGISLKAMSFMHHVEFLACVPYVYHKIIRGEVFANGQSIHRDFFIAVRYLQYEVVNDLSRLEEDLAATAYSLQAPLGLSAVWSVPMEAAMEVAMKGLRRDPWYLLRKPPAFVEGQIPCDGITIPREKVLPTAQYFS